MLDCQLQKARYATISCVTTWKVVSQPQHLSSSYTWGLGQLQQISDVKQVGLQDRCQPPNGESWPLPRQEVVGSLHTAQPWL